MLRRSFLFLPFFVRPVKAHSLHAGAIKIGHAWALPAALGEDGQCFMPILNRGPDDDAVIGASSPVCAAVELRVGQDYGQPAESEFALAPNSPVAMRPGARHLRLVAMNQPLAEGERFPMTLQSRKQGKVELDIYVEKTPGQ